MSWGAFPPRPGGRACAGSDMGCRYVGEVLQGARVDHGADPSEGERDRLGEDAPKDALNDHGGLATCPGPGFAWPLRTRRRWPQARQWVGGTTSLVSRCLLVGMNRPDGPSAGGVAGICMAVDRSVQLMKGYRETAGGIRAVANQHRPRIPLARGVPVTGSRTGGVS